MKDKTAKSKNTAMAPVRGDDVYEVDKCSLLTLNDIKDHLQTSIAQLQKLRRAGKILRPTVTLGRSPRWLDLEFYAWLKAGCPPAALWTWRTRADD